MEKYLLDTSIAIDYIRGNLFIIKTIDQLVGRVYVNNIIVAELSEGIFRVKNPNKMEEAIENFVEGVDGVFPIDKFTARKFGEIRATLRKQGNIIEDMDILIAASCLVNGCVLFTSNQKHFNRIDGLKVISLNAEVS